MAISHSIMPVSLQVKGLTTGFLRTAYGVPWLGQKLPAFTTREGALTPFETQYIAKDTGNNVTWSSSTVQYSTDLACHPAVWAKDPTSGELIFDNAKGCQVRDMGKKEGAFTDSEGRFTANYIGYHDNFKLAYGLEGPGCPPNASHNFLAFWLNNQSKDTPQLTALFCVGSYYFQEVQASISLPDLSVVSISPTGPKQVLSDQSFNHTHFEFLLNVGARESQTMTIDDLGQDARIDRFELPDELSLDLSPRLGNWSLTLPVTNMVAFAVGASRLLPEDYLKADNLALAFQAAHRLAFALAMNSIMVPNNSTTNIISGRRSSQMDAVFLTTTFTIIVQAALLTVLVLTVYLLIVCHRRHSRLDTNPSSITAIMSLSRDRELLGLLRDLDEADSHSFKNELQQHRFRLHYSEKTYGHVLSLESPVHGVSRVSDGKVASTSSITTSIVELSTRPAYPTELSLPVGLLFMSFLSALIVVLTILRHNIDRYNGGSPKSTLSLPQLR